MPKATRTGHVLLVEDDQGCIDLLTEVMAELHYQVVVTERVDEALRQLLQQRPVLVILDIMLPDANGLVVLDAIRANPAIADLPVLLCTATLVEAEDLPLAASDTRTQTVVKPFHIETFVRTVQHLLGQQ